MDPTAPTVNKDCGPTTFAAFITSFIWAFSSWYWKFRENEVENVSLAVKFQKHLGSTMIQCRHELIM